MKCSLRSAMSGRCIELVRLALWLRFGRLCLLPSSVVEAGSGALAKRHLQSTRHSSAK